MNRADLFNQVIETRKYQSYLEIGVDDPNNTFNHVKAKSKWAVDPYHDATQCHVWNEHNKVVMERAIQGTFKKMTSDQFFKSIKGIKIRWDMIFIDGMHTEEQVDKDIANALLHLNPGGIIFVDDCNPTNPYHVKMPPDPGQPWMGTVYRSMIKQVQRMWDSDNRAVVGTLDFNTGIGFIMPTKQSFQAPDSAERPAVPANWDQYIRNRKKLLAITDQDVFLHYLLPQFA